MKNLYKIALKIARSVLSDVILKDENAFQEYLKNHPDYREDTVFVVNGIHRKAPVNKKTPSNSEKLLHKKEFYKLDGSSPLFKNAEFYVNDLKSHGEIISDSELSEIDSYNEKFEIKHSRCSSIFKLKAESSEDYELEQDTKEAVAFEIDQIIGANVVPPTIQKEIDIDGISYIGSEQMLIPNAQTLHSLRYNQKDKLNSFSKRPNFKKQIEKMAVLDYILYSTDRHKSNLLIDDDGNAYAIDNGFCLPNQDVLDNYFYYSNNIKSIAIGILDQNILGDFDLSNVINDNYRENDFIEIMKYEKDNLSNSTIEMIKNIDIKEIINATDGKIDENAVYLMIKRIKKLKEIFN